MTSSPFRRRDLEARLADEARLAAAATRSASSKGRSRPEPSDPFRTPFERDRDRIVHSKAFRRLKHKTQVFINPEGDHYVTRLTHTLQVTQIGRSLAGALGLNEPLAEAICLGHDVGHSPFGHLGEEALTPFVDGEWHHAAQSVRVFEVLEPLNLTAETLDGIRAHSWKIEPPPSTSEGRTCRLADRIAYLTHDVVDALRAGVIAPAELPERFLKRFGEPGREWIATMIHAAIEESLRRGEVAMEEETLAAMHDLRDFMFERVYVPSEQDEERRRAVDLIRRLVEHFIEHPGEIPASYRHEDSPLVTQVVDYVSGMTDRFAINTYVALFGPDGVPASAP